MRLNTNATQVDLELLISSAMVFDNFELLDIMNGAIELIQSIARSTKNLQVYDISEHVFYCEEVLAVGLR